jgi:aldehyde:ferredoxin oxidoreductase
MSNKFKVLLVDLTQKKASIQYFDRKNNWLGGSGLAAGLFAQFADFKADPFDPCQPLILAIGPLTGYFPMMSKTVLGFLSPYHGQYAETHAGGRSALSLRFTGYDAIVIKGRASQLSCLAISSKNIELIPTPYLHKLDVFRTGKLLRKIFPEHSGHRSILRIGPAGENLANFALINVDTYRHFGRLGSGAIMGAKNLKGIVLAGDGRLPLEPTQTREYTAIYDEIFRIITRTRAVHKYHDLGTAQNLIPLNELQALPWRNLQETTDPKVQNISGETFAEKLLLRQTACAHCPVGCIHIGLLREKFGPEHEFLYRQVAYDYEPIFAVGSMLGMTQENHVLTLLEDVERVGLDVISTGVALAWATEALQKGVITLKQTLVPLKFGELAPYRQAISHLAFKKNDFYAHLAQGTLKAAQKFGGEDFACVLGQEMAGYATGEAYFVSQALGFRHSHLDSGAYSFDQKENSKNISRAINFMLDQERYRCLLNSMVGCLFGRKAYSVENICKALNSLGYSFTKEQLEEIAQNIQASRWALKIKTGFNPDQVKIPKRYLEVKNWKGKIDADFLYQLKKAYAQEIKKLGQNPG